MEINVINTGNLIQLEAAADLRRMHNEELHNLYHSPSIIRLIKMREK